MKLIMEGFRQYLEELDFDFSTFEIKKELNPKIWKGEKYRKIRDLHISQKRISIKPCNSCNVV